VNERMTQGKRVSWWPTLSGASPIFHATLLDTEAMPRSWYESLCGRPIGGKRGVTRPKTCKNCKRVLRRLRLSLTV
jgi:hypothetical protein